MSLDTKRVIIDRAELISLAVASAPSASVGEIEDLLGNIDALINRIDIFENMFSPGLSGQVTFRDTRSLSSLITLRGFELFRFGFSTVDPTDNSKTTFGPYGFVPYNQTNRSPIRQGLEEYSLGLCTSETLASTAVKFSKAYTGADGKGEYPHKIIEDIVRKPYGLNSKKPFVTLQETKSKIKLVVPYMRPLEIIRMLTLQGQTIDDDTNFVFFETLEGFHYVSFKKLIENAEQDAEIPLIQMTLTGQDQINTPTNIRADQLQLVSGYDLLYATSRGYFASTTLAPDVLSGRCGLKIYGAGMEDSPYSKRKKINGSAAREFYPSDFSMSIPATSRMFLVPTTAFSAANTTLTSKDKTISDNFIAQTLDDRNRELLGLQLRTLRGVVPGAPNLHAGKFIDVEFPSPLVSRRGTAGFQELASCRYLIIAAQHTLVNSGKPGEFLYTTTIEAVTDSYPAKT